MIEYGVCVGSDKKFERFALPGLQNLDAMNRTILSRNNDSIFTAYNRILDQAAAEDGLEALVLLHEDLEIRDVQFEQKLRRALASPDIAILGAIGGRGVRSVRWSKSRELLGVMPDRYYGENNFSPGEHDVDVLDGCILILSPWAVRSLRFDESRFHGFHAYDADICMQARAHGMRVRIFEFDAFHHTKGGLGDVINHAESDRLFRTKWGIPPDPWYVKVWDASPRLRKLMRPIVGAWRTRQR